jgi:hypothetical protein
MSRQKQGNQAASTALHRDARCLARGEYLVGVQEVRKTWTKRYLGEEYVKLLQTYSEHWAMPEPNQSRLFEEIGRVIAHVGGEVIGAYETLALLANKG